MRLILMLMLAFALETKAAGPKPEPESLVGQGNLITLRLVRGEPKAKLFVVGKEAATLNFEKDAKVLSIRALDPQGKEEELRFTPERGYYTVEKLPASGVPYRLSIKTKVKDQEETIELKVKAQPPR